MSRPFAQYSAKAAFKQIKESTTASDYISLKKTKYSLCNPNYCHPNKNQGSQSNYLLLRKANKTFLNPCNEIDKTQLYINLITKLNLNEVPVISYLSNNSYPVEINTSATPYLTYNIDPSGNLFGNTICGIYNWQNYIRSNTSFSVSGIYNITRDNNYNTIINFTGDGAFKVTDNLTINYIVVGGGGGGGGGNIGGSNGAGGGGGGGVSTGSFSSNFGTYTIYVGSGGLGGTKQTIDGIFNANNGSNGGSFEISGIITVSGGFGGMKSQNNYNLPSNGGASGNGGAGGIGGIAFTSSGGDGVNGGGGGGGGYATNKGGNGGISTISVYSYGTSFGAGGGGGGGDSASGIGGNSFAGDGGNSGNASTSYGGGGGGGSSGNGIQGTNGNGGNGGSGRVILYFNI